MKLPASLNFGPNLTISIVPNEGSFMLLLNLPHTNLKLLLSSLHLKATADSLSTVAFTSKKNCEFVTA